MTDDTKYIHKNLRIRVELDEDFRTAEDTFYDERFALSTGQSGWWYDRTCLTAMDLQLARRLIARREEGQPFTAEDVRDVTGDKAWPSPQDGENDPAYDTWDDENARFDNAGEFLKFVADTQGFSLNSRDGTHYVIWSKAEFALHTGSPEAKPDKSYIESWINGEVYGYIVEKYMPDADDPDRDDPDQWHETDSCWGFVGDADECMVQAWDEHGSAEPANGRPQPEEASACG